ncbi:unnamed protein product [Closterium sp. NIES-54]
MKDVAYRISALIDKHYPNKEDKWESVVKEESASKEGMSSRDVSASSFGDSGRESGRSHGSQSGVAPSRPVSSNGAAPHAAKSCALASTRTPPRSRSCQLDVAHAQQAACMCTHSHMRAAARTCSICNAPCSNHAHSSYLRSQLQQLHAWPLQHAQHLSRNSYRHPSAFLLEFPSWFIRAERFLKSQRQDNNTLWAHASGDLPQPPSPPALGAEPDETAQARFDKAHTARSVWQLLDTTVCIALASLLHETEESHFSQVRFAKDLIVAIKTHYSTPTSASLGRLFLQFLFPDLGMFDRAADLITHLRSLDVNYRAACTEARLALIPCPWRSLFTSSPQASLIALHLSTALKDIESNIRSIASASRAVIPPLFQGCTVPQLPTFTASLASTASLSTVETVAVSIVGERFRVKGGKRGGKGDDASGGGGSSGGPSDTSASGGGSTESGTWPARPTGGGVGAASWYTAQRLTECYIAYFV